MKHNSSDHSWARRIFTWTIWMCVRTCNILLHQPKSGTVQNVTSVFSRWECTVSVGLALGRSPFSSFLCIRSTVRVFITRIVLLLLYGRPLGILCWCKKKNIQILNFRDPEVKHFIQNFIAQEVGKVVIFIMSQCSRLPWLLEKRFHSAVLYRLDNLPLASCRSKEYATSSISVLCRTPFRWSLSSFSLM